MEVCTNKILSNLHRLTLSLVKFLRFLKTTQNLEWSNYLDRTYRLRYGQDHRKSPLTVRDKHRPCPTSGFPFASYRVLVSRWWTPSRWVSTTGPIYSGQCNEHKMCTLLSSQFPFLQRDSRGSVSPAHVMEPESVRVDEMVVTRRRYGLKGQGHLACIWHNRRVHISRERYTVTSQFNSYAYKILL